MLDRRFVSISIIILGIADEPDVNTPAGSQYIVGPNPTGSFANSSPNYIAHYDGTVWKFSAPKIGGMEVLNSATGEILSWNGNSWNSVLSIHSNYCYSPVLAVVPTGTALPASASAGDSFFKTDDAKLYTATAANSWDNGTLVAYGSRYASSSDLKIYTSNGNSAASENMPEGGFFFNLEDNCIYILNRSAFVKIGGSSGSSGTTYSMTTEFHSITANELSAKSFSLSHSIASGQENNILLFVEGVAQSALTDFSASGNSISWNAKGLDTIGLREGDSFIIHYAKE